MVVLLELDTIVEGGLTNEKCHRFMLFARIFDINCFIDYSIGKENIRKKKQKNMELRSWMFNNEYLLVFGVYGDRQS